MQCLCDSVCPHYVTKTTEKYNHQTWHRDSPLRYLAHQLILGQGHMLQTGNRVAGMSYTLSSAQPLVKNMKLPAVRYTLILQYIFWFWDLKEKE